MVSFYFLHQTIEIDVNNVNYNVVEAVATSGKFSKDLFDYLSDSVSKYGDYYIKIKFEKQIKPGVYDTYFDNSDIIDKHLRIGDRITVYLEDRSLTLFGRLINTAFLGSQSDRMLDTHIKSVKSAIIAKDSKNLVKGYDVISDICSWEGKAYISDDGLPVNVFVKTKLSMSGKEYDVTNPDYGDTSDESGNTGENYIFDNGDFIKEEIEYDQSGIKMLSIKYIQQ